MPPIPHPQIITTEAFRLPELVVPPIHPVARPFAPAYDYKPRHRATQSAAPVLKCQPGFERAPDSDTVLSTYRIVTKTGDVVPVSSSIGRTVKEVLDLYNLGVLPNFCTIHRPIAQPVKQWWPETHEVPPKDYLLVRGDSWRSKNWADSEPSKDIGGNYRRLTVGDYLRAYPWRMVARRKPQTVKPEPEQSEEQPSGNAGEFPGEGFEEVTDPEAVVSADWKILTPHGNALSGLGFKGTVKSWERHQWRFARPIPPAEKPAEQDGLPKAEPEVQYVPWTEPGEALGKRLKPKGNGFKGVTTTVLSTSWSYAEECLLFDLSATFSMNGADLLKHYTQLDGTPAGKLKFQ